MKKLLALLLALCLMLGLSSAVLAADDSLDTPASITEMFARLQMELAQSAKDSAQGNMDAIQKAQQEQREVTAYLDQARALQEQAKGSGSYTTMPDDMKDYMDQNQLAYDSTGGDALHDKDEWDVAIQSLQARQEKLGMDIQQQMSYVQDFMGQYNSYIQGANSSSATLSSIARGQSLFSTSGSGEMAAAPIATSLLGGIALGMLAMWFIKRPKQRGDEK